MNYAKLCIATILGAVVSFLSGWLFYGILLRDMMTKAMTPEAAAVNKPEPNLVGIFISNLIYALLIAYIFERWAKIRTFMGGAMGGALIGLLFAASVDVSFWAMLNMYNDFSFIFIDIAVNAIMGAILGGAIGWYLGFNRKD